MSDFIYHFQPGDKDKPVILALHGTGGDENDLVPLAMQVSPGSAVLSPRGKILENGMPRFFKRLAEGIFDQEDLVFRTHELADFILSAAEKHGFDPGRLFALGYSNGANIAASLLLLRPETVAGGMLMRAMVPFEPETFPDLSSKKILLLSGIADPIANEDQSQRLENIFQQSHAQITHIKRPTGHGLGQQDVIQAKDWINGVS